MPLDLRRFQSAIRSKRVVGDQDACSVAVVRYGRLGEAWVLLTSSVAISWRMSMTSRAAFRRASADVCSAAGIVVNDTVTGLFYTKQVAEINLCLLLPFSRRNVWKSRHRTPHARSSHVIGKCLAIAPPDPHWRVVSIDISVVTYPSL